ncbi:MAG: hypothetical protein Kow0089_12650 [Desulfobulbaceae bacterium]
MNPGRRVFQSVSILLLLAVTTLAYSNSFQGEFTLDDFVNILNSQGIRQFQPTLEGIVRAATDEPNSSRWFANLSFALNFYLHGEETWGYHLVNLLVHLGTALLLYFLSSTLLTLPALAGHCKKPAETAFFATLLWAVHPLQTNAVTYIVQRMTSLAALFYLAAFFCYIRVRLEPRFTSRSIVLLTACMLSWLLSVFSKQNGLMLPFMLLGCEFFFFNGWEKIRRMDRVVLFLTCGGAALIAGGMLYLGWDRLAQIVSNYRFRDFTLTERLLTQPRVIFLYLSLLALPLPSRLNLNHDMAVSHGLLSPPQTLLALTGLLGLVLLCVLLFRRQKLLSFGIFWFLGNLVIESTIIPLEMVYEHRLYLPSTIFILALSAWGVNLLHNKPIAYRAGFTVLIFFFSLWTWQRNQVWADNLTIWSDVARKSPGSMRARNNLGTVYHERGEYALAEQSFKEAIRLAPHARQPYVSLGHLYITMNRLPEAMGYLQAALARETFLNPALIYHYMGIVYRKTGRDKEAILAAQKALQLDPDNLDPLVTLGISLANTERLEEADRIFSEAEEKGLSGTNLYNNWGTVVFRKGEIDRAIGYFKKALEYDPDHPESHYNLGLAYGARGMIDEARREMTLSLELQRKKSANQQKNTSTER